MGFGGVLGLHSFVPISIILELFKFKVLLLKKQKVSLVNKVPNYGGIILYCSILVFGIIFSVYMKLRLMFSLLHCIQSNKNW
jgi:hypothetical protein